MYESAASDDCVNLQNTCFCSILPRIETTADEEGFFVVNQDIEESGSEIRKSYLHVLLNKTRLTGEDPLDSWKTLLQSIGRDAILFAWKSRGLVDHGEGLFFSLRHVCLRLSAAAGRARETAAECVPELVLLRRG